MFSNFCMVLIYSWSQWRPIKLLDSISKMNINWNIIKNIRFEFHECFWIKMSLQFISIFGCDNKSSTSSLWLLAAAKISAVSLNDWVQFQKWF